MIAVACKNIEVLALYDDKKKTKFFLKNKGFPFNYKHILYKWGELSEFQAN